jgi:hypothetical protein
MFYRELAVLGGSGVARVQRGGNAIGGAIGNGP